MSNEFKLEMADVVKAHLDVPGFPVLTSNQCHAIAMKLNAMLSAATQPPALGGEPEVVGYGFRNTMVGRSPVMMELRPDIPANDQYGGQLWCPLITQDDYRAHHFRLQAENESLRKSKTDWQAECLKRGFEYVREPDDHYVLADAPEMADLLGLLLGVEVRNRENYSYGDTVSNLTNQVDAGIDAFHRAYEAEKERDQLKALLFLANAALEGRIDAALSKPAGSEQ
ncbi:hypothetical protein AO286_21735 [Pseudomonas syringae]|uniref:hypothetical protein n=1 Tax=Pseudomonas syringae group TaxID=136849 RepID=UPI000C07F125|nr:MULTISPECIES: hypothetical protein [Pseudomonas syringae group]PHN65671.1 hypothetical protein AO286_21735 [Pseudomonas syringae]